MYNPNKNVSFEHLHAGPRQVGPYSNHHRILVVGDGDLSFSLALATELGGQNLTATTYDSKSEVYSKYDNARGIVNALLHNKAEVIHGVDGTKLSEYDWAMVTPYHRIVFNFPHIGGSTKDDVRVNQELLSGFFRSCSLLLADDGHLHVALRPTPFYESWDIKHLAHAQGYHLVHTEPFLAEQFNGYAAKRTTPAMREAPSTDDAVRYVFAIGYEAEQDERVDAPALIVKKSMTKQEKALVRAEKKAAKKQAKLARLLAKESREQSCKTQKDRSPKMTKGKKRKPVIAKGDDESKAQTKLVDQGGSETHADVSYAGIDLQQQKVKKRKVQRNHK